jgi:hypothetical protein
VQTPQQRASSQITSLFEFPSARHTSTSNACHCRACASCANNAKRAGGCETCCCQAGWKHIATRRRGAKGVLRRRGGEEEALNCRRARSRRPDSPGARLSTDSSGAGVSQARPAVGARGLRVKRECRCAAPPRRCAACSPLARARRRAPARPRLRLLLACAPPPRARGRPWVRAATTRARMRKKCLWPCSDGHAAHSARRLPRARTLVSVCFALHAALTRPALPVHLPRFRRRPLRPGRRPTQTLTAPPLACAVTG